MSCTQEDYALCAFTESTICFEEQPHSYDSMALDSCFVPMDAVKTTNESYFHFIEVEAEI